MPVRSALARLALLVAVLLLVATAPASAFRLQQLLAPVAGNPVEVLASLPADAAGYDRATHCTRKPQPGMTAFRRWLETHARGLSWGVYRCERWGKHSASLHAEGRAIDWHLDVGRPADRAAARKLITGLLAPDSAGTSEALARRMGIEEIIWDCSYWSVGMPEFRRYSPCFNKHGQLRRKVDRTTAHRNHIHFGMTKPGATGRTTFWRYLTLQSVGRLREELAATLPPVGADPSQDDPAEGGDAPAAGEETAGWDDLEPEEEGADDGW